MNMMKKLVAIMFVVSAMFLSSCGQPSEDDIFTIDERFFVLQMDEIFLNSSRFVGRTIRYEGFFGSMQIGDEPAFYYVARTTFGCCGADGLIGFEVVLGAIEPVADDAWVEYRRAGDGRQASVLERHISDGTGRARRGFRGVSAFFAYIKPCGAITENHRRFRYRRYIYV